MGSLKFSQQYGNNKISVNQNQKVVTVPVGVVEPGDKHFIGMVQEITEDGKFICSAIDLSDLVECIKGCNAEVGDEVIICLMQDGQYVVVARVGGDLGGGEVGGGVLPEYGSATDYIAGKVFAFAGNFTPAGCLLCDGSEVSRSDYWELFAIVGTTYGAGDGSTTFNLPNIESRTIIGESDNYAFGSTGGEEAHTLTVEEMPSHNHSTYVRGFSGVETKEAFTKASYDYQNTATTAGAALAINESTGGDQPHNNMQPYIVMRFFITTGKGEPASGINPADYVVEWGKDETWTWVKYASGMAECWGGYSDWFNISTEWSGFYYGSFDAIEYPFEFTNAPYEWVTFRAGSNAMYVSPVVNSTTKTHHGYLYGPKSTPSINGWLFFHAKGFWKDSPASGGTETIAPTIAERFEKLETDYIVAEGQSNDWHYWKFASGKAICTQHLFFANLSYSSASGSSYYNSTDSIPFPFAFTEKPRVVGTVWASTGLMSCSINSLTTSSVNFFLFCTTKMTNSPDLFIFVEGWWK